MKQFVSRSLMVVALCSAAVAAPWAQAQDGTRIGFVNTDRMLREATPAKAAQTKLEQEFSRREKEIDDAGSALKTASERFEREADLSVAQGQVSLANLQRDTALAWIERYYTQQMRDLVLRQLEETRLQVQAAETGFGIGRSSQADVFAARSALVLLEERLSTVDRQQRNAALVLARWVGPDAERPAT